MDNTNLERSLNLNNILLVLKKRMWLIMLVTSMAVFISGIVSLYILKPVFESRISIVIGKDLEQSENRTYDYNDIMMYQNLVKTYTEIAQSRVVAEKTVVRLCDLSITPSNIQSNTTATPQGNTQIMDIKFKSRDRYKAKAVLDQLATAFIYESKRIYPDGNVQMIDEAVVPSNPISPNKKLNIAIGFLIGIVCSMGLVFLLENLDGSIKTQGEAEHYLEMPVVGIIPKDKFSNYGDCA